MQEFVFEVAGDPAEGIAHYGLPAGVSGTCVVIRTDDPDEIRVIHNERPAGWRLCAYGRIQDHWAADHPIHAARADL